MNGEGKGDAEAVKMEEEAIEKLVYMWGYLPGAMPQRSPLTSPMAVRVPASINSAGDSWKDVCGGGCGFAMALSGALLDFSPDMFLVIRFAISIFFFIFLFS